jgi:hypothetical protein
MPVATAGQHARTLDSAGASGCALVGVNISSPETFTAVLRGFAEPHSDGIIQASTGEGEVLSGTAVKNIVAAARARQAFAPMLDERSPVLVALHTDLPPDKLDGLLHPLLAVSLERRHERPGAYPTAAVDDVRWADGIAFGTPLGDGRPPGALMRFIEAMEPLWISGSLNDKVVTVFRDRPEQIAPDSVLHPIYDGLYRWQAVIVGPPAIELAVDARPAGSVPEHPSPLPAARLRTAQCRAARLARLAGVLADQRHRHERFAIRAA